MKLPNFLKKQQDHFVKTGNSKCEVYVFDGSKGEMVVAGCGALVRGDLYDLKDEVGSREDGYRRHVFILIALDPIKETLRDFDIQVTMKKKDLLSCGDGRKNGALEIRTDAGDLVVGMRGGIEVRVPVYSAGEVRKNVNFEIDNRNFWRFVKCIPTGDVTLSVKADTYGLRVVLHSGTTYAYLLGQHKAQKLPWVGA